MIRWLCFWLACVAFAQSDALLEKADSAFREGDLKQAEILARRVVAQDPRSVHAHMILGVIAAQNKQWDASNRHFTTVVRLDPTNPHGYFYLGQAKLYQQQWEPAIQQFMKALDRGYPDRERLSVELALAQNEAGRPKQALETLSKIAPPADGPLAAQYQAVTAFALGHLNDPARAIDAMRRARTLDEMNPQYPEFLITTLIATDQTPAALAEAIQAQKKFPDNAEIQFLFGLANYHVTESPLTSVALRNLREAEPDGARVLLVEGMLHRKLGRNDEALRAFRTAAERGAPDAHLLLGIVEREAGNYEAAEKEYREAERLNPQNGQVMLELGKVFATRGDLPEARTRLEKAVAYMPASPSAHYQLGLVYRKLGEAQKADEHLRRSRELEAAQAQAARPK